jgi:predicted nuclease of restriction endonuclease-like RecB superfamily
VNLRVEHLPCIIEFDVVAPSFLADVDQPWLQRLIERACAAEGLRAGDVDEHLLAPLAIAAPPQKQRLAAFILAKQLTTKTASPFTPRDARERVFVEAATRTQSAALASAATSFGVDVDQLRAGLFADLPGERVVTALSQPPSPGALAAKANLWLAQAFVSRAVRVKLDVKGVSRVLVLNAKAKGLLCTVSGSVDGSAAVLELSGPLSLFKNTRLYGRALASLVPTLPFCDRWILDAECFVYGRHVSFRLSTGAPIEPADAPKRFDSKAEERFARDFDRRFARAPGPWRLVREPRPVVVGDGLAFPDFALEHDGGAKKPVFVELVGFWTPAYVAQKLDRYRRARDLDLILCVDDTLACADGALLESARIVRFRRRVDVDAVLAAADALALA